MEPAFFVQNREKLATQLEGGLVVVSAYSKMQGAADSASPFEQDANFWWLSGIDAPEWWLIIEPGSRKSWLVAPDVEDAHLLFDGSLAPDDAVFTAGVSGAMNRDEGIKKLRELAKKHPVVYTHGEPPYAEYVDFVLNPAPKKLRDILGRIFSSVHDCRKEIARLRAIKQPAEIAAITEAATITVDAFEETRSMLASCRYEYEVEAELTYRFRKQGASHAFAPIVASGSHACTLHYGQNSGKLDRGEMVLIDAGARLGGYPADVTRTYAMGKPTKRQAAVHEAVKIAEERIIALLEPELRIEDYVRSVDSVMKESLLSLGLMKDSQDEEKYRRYFPHAVSHGLGIDVHDSLGGWKYLQPNMILTVEPGIYIPEEGIGVRIEDDILITQDGHRNLTGSLSTEM